MESQKILCDVCGASFTMNKNLLRHVREKHQGMKITDNEKRKKDQESTDKARKQGLLACGSWAACEESVESNPPRQCSSHQLTPRMYGYPYV